MTRPRNPLSVLVLSDSTFAKDLYDKGAEISQFNWNKSDTYGPALLGVKTVFCTMPHLVDGVDKFHAFTNACKNAGVKNFVKLSFSHALISEADTMKGFAMANDKEDPYLKVPFIRMHRQCDEHLIRMKFPFNYTILFAGHFMSNPTVYQGKNLAEEHAFYGASHGRRVDYVSPNDVAEVALRAMVNPKKHHKVGYKLNGPNPITDDDVARSLGLQLGIDIRYVDQASVQEFAKLITAPDWGSTEDVVSLENLKATGVEIDATERSSSDIVKVCGHQAESFQDYLAAKETMSPMEMNCMKMLSATSQLLASG